MGQKVNPKIFRLNINNNWDSTWYCKKNYSFKLWQDIQIRRAIYKNYHDFNIGKILIERLANKIIVNIFMSPSSRSRNIDANKIQYLISEITNKYIIINIKEIKIIQLDALYLCKLIAKQLEKRIPPKKVVKKIILDAMNSGAKGIKILISGRIGGIDIARSECYKKGKIPLHTFRSVINYDIAEAKTIYGLIGIKIWIYNGIKSKLRL